MNEDEKDYEIRLQEYQKKVIKTGDFIKALGENIKQEKTGLNDLNKGELEDIWHYANNIRKILVKGEEDETNSY